MAPHTLKWAGESCLHPLDSSDPFRGNLPCVRGHLSFLDIYILNFARLHFLSEFCRFCSSYDVVCPRGISLLFFGQFLLTLITLFIR